MKPRTLRQLHIIHYVIVFLLKLYNYFFHILFDITHGWQTNGSPSPDRYPFFLFPHKPLLSHPANSISSPHSEFLNYLHISIINFSNYSLVSQSLQFYYVVTYADMSVSLYISLRFSFYNSFSDQFIHWYFSLTPDPFPMSHSPSSLIPLPYHTHNLQPSCLLHTSLL